MDGMGSAAIAGVIVGLIPLLLLGLAVAVFVAVLVAISLFLDLLERPIIYWFYAASVIFEILLLVPLAIGVVAVCIVAPEIARPVVLWAGAFGIASLLPMFWLWTKIKRQQSRDGARQ